MKANQIQEIDKHICVIESTVKMLERNSVDTLVRETVFAATAKISDILAGEGREKKPDEKKPVRYFFNLQTFVVLKAGEGCLISDGDKIPAFSSDKFLEVTEADLPYLQKPAGAWEFRKYNDCDTVLEYKTWGHGDLINAACPPFVDDSNVVLRRYRWCKPAKPITKKKEKTVRYFFSLATFEIIEFTKGFIGWDTKHPLVCFADVTRDSCYFLEVTVADLPYLKKPEGDWELRTVQEEDYYLSSYFTSQGEWRKERHARIFSEGEITHMDFLQGYRWCKPLSKKEEKRVYTIDLPALEVRLLNHQAHALRKAGLLGRPIKEV